MQSTGKRLYIVGLSRQHVTVEVCVVYIEKFDKSASSEFLAEMPPAHGCGHVKCTNRGVYHSTASDTSSVVLCSYFALLYCPGYLWRGSSHMYRAKDVLVTWLFASEALDHLIYSRSNCSCMFLILAVWRSPRSLGKRALMAWFNFDSGCKCLNMGHISDFPLSLLQRVHMAVGYINYYVNFVYFSHKT